MPHALLPLPLSGLAVGPAAGQGAADRLTPGALYRAVDSLSPAIRAANAAADAANARVPGTERLPDPRLQVATVNRELPGLALQVPLGMGQIQLTQMTPIPGTGELGLVHLTSAGGQHQWSDRCGF